MRPTTAEPEKISEALKAIYQGEGTEDEKMAKLTEFATTMGLGICSSHVPAPVPPHYNPRLAEAAKELEETAKVVLRK